MNDWQRLNGIEPTTPQHSERSRGFAQAGLSFVCALGIMACTIALCGCDTTKPEPQLEPRSVSELVDVPTWCEAFELALESCDPTAYGDDVTSIMPVVTGCTDVALAAAGTDEGRTELADALVSCAGVGASWHCDQAEAACAELSITIGTVQP